MVLALEYESTRVSSENHYLNFLIGFQSVFDRNSSATLSWTGDLKIDNNNIGTKHNNESNEEPPPGNSSCEVLVGNVLSSSANASASSYSNAVNQSTGATGSARGFFLDFLCPTFSDIQTHSDTFNKYEQV